MNVDKPVLGTVLEALPIMMFKVALYGATTGEANPKEILVYLSGKMRIHKIKVLIGDRVELILDQYGERGRIIKRL